MRRSIWITGAGGLIGNYLVQTAPQFAPEARIVALTRPTLDLANASQVRAAFHRDPPDAIIHCAALSKTPDCQANPPLAHRLNVEVTASLADLARDRPFLFFSTDLVFDGRKGGYVETDPVNPLSVYAQTKAEAEALVLQNPRHLVMRTSLNGGVSPTGDRGFNEQIRQAWREGALLRLFTDEFRSPIAAEVTARAAWELLAGNHAGLFHVAGSERLSRWQIGQLLAASARGVTPRLEPATLRDYRGAPRPPDTSLNCAKAQRVLSVPLPAFSEWISRHPNF